MSSSSSGGEPARLSTPLLSSRNSRQMYDNWGSFSKQYLVDKPHMDRQIGGNALRSLQKEPRPQEKMPGAGRYTPQNNDFSKALRDRKSVKGTMSTASRTCLLPTALHTMPYRSSVSPRPGSADYSPIYHDNLFEETLRNEKTWRFSPKEMELYEIKRKLNESEQLVDRLDSLHANSRTMAKLKTSKSYFKKLQQRREELIDSLAQEREEREKQKLDKSVTMAATRARSRLEKDGYVHRVPFNKSSKRFFHPMDINATVSPGPGQHHISESISTFGVEERAKAFTIPRTHRSVDPTVPVSKSLFTIQMYRGDKGSFYGDITNPSPQSYAPDLIPRPHKSNLPTPSRPELRRDQYPAVVRSWQERQREQDLGTNASTVLSSSSPFFIGGGADSGSSSGSRSRPRSRSGSGSFSPPPPFSGFAGGTSQVLGQAEQLNSLHDLPLRAQTSHASLRERDRRLGLGRDRDGGRSRGQSRGGGGRGGGGGGGGRRPTPAKGGGEGGGGGGVCLIGTKITIPPLVTGWDGSIRHQRWIW